MPLLIFAGIPKPVGLRNRGFMPSTPGWQVVVVPSPANSVSVTQSWDDVLQLANDADAEGAHILAFHSRIDQRSRFEKSVYGRHRLIWLDSQLVKAYGSTEFNRAVGDIVDFENQWRECIRPPNHRHALILPEPSFTPHKALSDVWVRAQRLRVGADSVERVSRGIDAFQRRHYSGGVWQDQIGLVFDPGGVRHGTAEKEWRWKYTHLVPAQFHYDVRSFGNKGFQVRDRSGVIHSFSEYTNIDCHGVIRGGR